MRQVISRFSPFGMTNHYFDILLFWPKLMPLLSTSRFFRAFCLDPNHILELKVFTFVACFLCLKWFCSCLWYGGCTCRGVRPPNPLCTIANIGGHAFSWAGFARWPSWYIGIVFLVHSLWWPRHQTCAIPDIIFPNREPLSTYCCWMQELWYYNL